MKRVRIRYARMSDLCLEELPQASPVRLVMPSGAFLDTTVDSSGCAVFPGMDLQIVPIDLPVEAEVVVGPPLSGERIGVTLLPPDIDRVPVLG